MTQTIRVRWFGVQTWDKQTDLVFVSIMAHYYYSSSFNEQAFFFSKECTPQCRGRGLRRADDVIQ